MWRRRKEDLLINYGWSAHVERMVLLIATVLAGMVLAAGCGVLDGSPESREQGGASAPEATSPERGQSAGATSREQTVEVGRLAYRSTQEAQTAKMFCSSTVSGLPDPYAAPGEQDPGSFRTTSQGVVDFANEEAAYTMDLSMFGAFEVRQVGNVMYQKFPEDSRSEMPGGKPWVKIDLDTLYREQYEESLSELQGGTIGSPVGQLEYLKGVSESVDKLGVEEVRGTETTHYRAEIELAKSLDTPQLKQAYEQTYGRAATGNVPVELWLDAQDRVRRFQMSLSVPVPEDPASQVNIQESTAGEPVTEALVTVVEELYDFGTPVEVSPPPPEMTADYEDLMANQKVSS